MGFVLDGLETEAYDRHYSDRQLALRILNYFRPLLPLIVKAIISVTIASLSDGLLLFLIAVGINNLVVSLTWVKITVFIGAILLLCLLSWASNIMRTRYITRAVGGIVFHIRHDAFAALMKANMAFFTQYTSGKLVSRITSDTEEFGTVITLTTGLISELVLILILTAIMFMLNVHLALIAIGVVPIILLVALSFRHIARRTVQYTQRATANTNANIQEAITGISVTKSFHQEHTLYKEFNQINKQFYHVSVRQGLIFNTIFPILATIASLGTAFLVYKGGLYTFTGVLTVGYWLFFIQSIDIFWLPLTSIASFWSQFQQGLAAGERIFALIDIEAYPVQLAQQPVERLQGHIEFKHLRFHYTDHEEVLSDFNLTIHPGEAIALIGHTGAGKSTLCKLIARFYDFQEGHLLVDGQDVRTFQLHQYRRQLGIVPQVPFLFTGTLADNIRYIRPEATDEEVAQAAEGIGKGTWLKALPLGLNTPIQEGGKNLSSGQRQLVALSRILLQKPSILLLDEATASVDPITEAQLQEGIELLAKQRTTIIIAHRLSTVQRADRIIALRKGQIIEEGSHEQLLQQGGYYSELYNTYFRHQTLDYEPGEGFVLTKSE